LISPRTVGPINALSVRGRCSAALKVGMTTLSMSADDNGGSRAVQRVYVLDLFFFCR
jgi:hypothetical protein